MTDMDGLSLEYLSLRTERDILEKRFKEQDAALEAQMKAIEDKLLDELNATNATSINTNTATVLRRVTKRYDASACWEDVYELIHKHKAYGLLQKRVHDGNMSTFLEEHPDEYPAGLKLDSRYAVTVKRKSGV